MHRLDTTSPKWLAVAENEIGVREVRGRNHNWRIIEYLKTALNIGKWGRERDETPWCAAFVNWCLEESGVSGTDNALARSFIGWGDPVLGDRLGAVAVVKRKGNKDASTGSRAGFHVGFLVKSHRYSYRILGGNQGDSVCYRNFPRGRYDLVALRWPKERQSNGEKIKCEAT
jgi:uncharacterized protein (TIGR02594 family)